MAENPELNSIKILLAEDDPVTRLLYSRNLKAAGYEVKTAENGEEAWQMLQAEPFNILISDWEMPLLNGLGLCQRVKSAPDLPYIYVLLLTARDDASSLIQGLDIGADDYLAKTCDIEVFRARVRSAGRIIQLTAELESKNLHLKEANERLDKAYSYIKRDLELAAKAQFALLPPQNYEMDGIRFAWLFLPSTFVGGDTLNYYRISECQIAFYQLDVVGHGVASALHSFSLTKMLSPAFGGSEAIRCDETNRQPPNSASDFVAQINQQFQSPDSLDCFTMAYGLITPRLRTLDLCLAGHQQPIYIPSGGLPRLVGSNGFPVGIFPDSDFQSSIIRYARGDRLFLHSDGIAECINNDHEQFGLGRLQQFLYEARHEDLGKLGDLLMGRLRQWIGSGHFEDDISMLAIEITQ